MKTFFNNILIFLKKLFNKNNESEEIVSGSTTMVENNENTEITVEMEKNNFNENIVILLDNGHAKSTKGKRSPLFDDGKTRFFEYEFSRDIVRRISEKLKELNIKYEIITPEVEEDIKLSVRANRANQYCNKYGTKNCLLISIHANAASKDGNWTNARGWSVYTTKGITKSDAIATTFFNEAEKILPSYNMTLRKDMSDGDPDYEENFTIIYATKCPAILTENLFMDNKLDVKFLMSEEGRNVIADIHVNAIKQICKVK